MSEPHNSVAPSLASQGIITIEPGSPAYTQIEMAIKHQRSIHIQARRDGVAIKQGQYGWSPVLRTDFAPQDREAPPNT